MDKIKVGIIGMGSRGFRAYASVCKYYEKDIEIVAVAEPRESQMKLVRQAFPYLSDEQCFKTGEELLAKEKLADVLFICTLDRMHYSQASAALKKGYDLLLEKPISTDSKECKEIAELANKLNRKVIVCHVLRYTLFYQKLKELIEKDKVGDVVAIQAIERVGYWHQGHSFVRGNWNNSDTTSPMILQKSCHDMDIYLWLLGKRCKAVSSFGDLTYFKKENAPEGAPKRCNASCPAYDTCVYNPYKFYGAMLKKENFEWPLDVVIGSPSEENLKMALEEGPYGKCIYHCDNNVVDHQVVNLLCEENATISFTMCAFTGITGRSMIIMGTKGSIEADMESEKITLYEFGKQPQVVKVEKQEDSFGHGGGDERIIESLIRLFKYGQADSSITTIDVSTESHYVALAAEESRKQGGKCIDLKEFVANL